MPKGQGTGAKRGRPTKYTAKMAERAAKLSAMGAIDTEIADLLDIGMATFYRWRNEHEAFREALKIGKEPADDRVKRSLYHRANGYDYTEQQAIKVKAWDSEGKPIERVEVVEVTRHNPASDTAAIFWLKNREPGKWRTKDPDEAPPLEGPVTKIENVIVYPGGTPDAGQTENDPD